MNKKCIIYMVIASILVLGLILYIFFNNQKKPSVYLQITCDEETISATYKEGDMFKCTLIGDDYEIKIDNIGENKINLSSSTYGLFPLRDDGSMSLIANVKKFELYKGKPLVLGLQVTDASYDITIVWK